MEYDILSFFSIILFSIALLGFFYLISKLNQISNTLNNVSFEISTLKLIIEKMQRENQKQTETATEIKPKENEELSGQLATIRAKVADLTESVNALQESANQAIAERRALDVRISDCTASERSARNTADKETLAYVKLEEQIAIRSQLYSAYPYFEAALASRAERYMDQRKQLFELEEEGRVLVLEPPEPVEVKVNEKSGEALLSLYLTGRQVALERLEEIESFIE